MATRILTVSRSEAGWTVLAWLCARLKTSRGGAARLLQGRKVRLAGNFCTNPAWRLRAGQRVEVQVGASHPPRRPPAAPGRTPSRAPPGARPVIRFLDDHVVVVEKPAGLTTMRHAEDVAEHGRRARRFLPQTLADLLPGLIAQHTSGPPGQVRAVHRLDRDTSGLVVFARTPQAERDLGRQFRAHTTERLYLAVVRGKAASGRIESWLVRDRGDGRRGSAPSGTEPPAGAQHAVTYVRVIEELGDFTLVECRLETGRTHQVRIHLGEASTPLCGERIYDRPVHGQPLPDGSGLSRIGLHAAELGLCHPESGKPMRWSSPLPPDLAALVERLRHR
jgi:23S rRNA pseudouridine1911/1915/1917 synthase